MRVAAARRITTGDERVLRHAHERRARTVDERNDDSLADTGPKPLNECAKNRDRGVLAGNDVSQGNPCLHRITIWLAVDRHPPTLGLRDEVVPPGTHVRAKARNRAPNKVRSSGAAAVA